MPATAGGSCLAVAVSKAYVAAAFWEKVAAASPTCHVLMACMYSVAIERRKTSCVKSESLSTWKPKSAAQLAWVSPSMPAAVSKAANDCMPALN